MFFKSKAKTEIDYERLPVHIGVIMDGNGRWAKKRGLPRSAGHSAGADTLKKIVTECNQMGIKYITVYAFSTENWKRPNEEVEFLMNLLLGYLRDAERSLAGENVVIRAIGSRKELSEEIQRQIIKTEEFTKNNTGIIMNIALNYGAREELLSAVRHIAGRGVIYRRAAGPGPDYQDQRGGAPEQFYALASRLFGAVVYEKALAGFQ